jgi:uncharacterized membrane protein
MLTYILICISLSLLGLSTIEFLYLFYLERIEKERQKKIIELEQRCKILTERLKQAEQNIQRQILVIEALHKKQSELEISDFNVEIIDEIDEEEWAEYIEDKSLNQ